MRPLALSLCTVLLAGTASAQSGLDDHFMDYTVVHLDLPAEAGQAFPVQLAIDGYPLNAFLYPFNQRSENFQVLVPRDGELVPVEVEGPKTYRGEFAELPGSLIAVSLIDGQLEGSIWLGQDSPLYGIMPADEFDSSFGPRAHVVYRAKDVIQPQTTQCPDPIVPPTHWKYQNGNGQSQQGGGQSGNVHDHDDDAGQTGAGGRTQFAGQNLETCEIAFDTDYEYYQDNGSNVQATIDDIEALTNTVHGYYERDVEICYQITTIIVRDNPNDPYSSNTYDGVLNEFVNEWRSNQTGVQRDIAHMLSGKNVGGVIGVAYLGVICDMTWGYGVTWNYTNDHTSVAGVMAHELGHNWDADHCNGGACNNNCNDCRIMCACVWSCCGDMTHFGQTSINSITNFKNSRNCLDAGCNTGGGGGTFTLQNPVPGLAGQVNTFTAINATPGGQVTYAWSLSQGSSATGCGANWDLANARIGGTAIADGSGNATLTANVPAGASGRVIQLQALDDTTCTVSNLISWFFF